MNQDLGNRNKGIFFDLYGTLLIYGDMKRAWADWLRALYSSLVPLGLSLSLDSLSRKCDRFLEKEEPAGERGILTPFEKRIQSLCEGVGLCLSADVVARIADRVAAAWEEHVRIDPDAPEVLAALQKGKSLALVSNFDHPRHLRKMVAFHGLSPLFRSIVISAEVGVKKPNPSIFRRALEETGLSPTEVAYVGDTEGDVIGAAAAGIRPVLIKRPFDCIDSSTLDFRTDRDTGAASHSGVGGLDVPTIASLRELLALPL